MRHSRLAVLCGLLLFGGASLAQVAGLKSFYETGLQRNGIVGSRLVLLRGSDPAFQDSYGYARLATRQPVDDNTAFHWASLTKTFTAIAIMQLRDHGRLKLDDPVIKYIPELAAVHDPWGPVSAITIRQLLSHSAGFRNPTWPWSGDQPWYPFEPTRWSQIVAMLPYTEVKFTPGSRYSYSNLGYVFLGQVIERLSGDDYEVYVDKNIFKPLRMYHSYFDKAPYSLLKYRSASYQIKEGKLSEMPFDFDTGITVSNGGLNAPLADMVKYLKFLMGEPALDSDYEEVLKRSSLREMFQPVLRCSRAPGDPLNAPDENDSVGLGFFVRQQDGVSLVGHAGEQNGFMSHFYIQPESHRAYIVAYNTAAYDSGQNTAVFDNALRDYLVRHFFQPPSGGR
ncbi:MAG TPA: serine hydrolase domain-containing protein [Terriglobales bacterium]|nr:serine hydrolase domain-containing protein [Terriglobales bacterium]